MLRAQSTIVSSIARGVQPSSSSARALEYSCLRPSCPVTERMPGSNSPIARTRRSGTERFGTFGGLVSQLFAQDRGDVRHPLEGADRDQALATGLGGAHRADLEVGDVAHVDQVEADPRRAGHPGEQALHDFERGRAVGAAHRPEDGAGVDDGQALGLAHLLDQIPGRPLGDRLRARIGRQRRIVEVGPVRLVQAPPRCLGAATDGRDRRGDDDPRGAGPQGSAEHPQGSLPRRHDQLVRVLRLHQGKGRGDVQDVVAAGHRLVPARVAEQVRGEDGDDRRPRPPSRGSPPCSSAPARARGPAPWS